MKKSLHLLLAALLVTTVSACNDDPLFDIPCDAPTADAGADQTVAEEVAGEGAAVLLDGSASIPAEGDAIATYAWTEDGIPIEGASQGLGQLLATFDVGEHNVTLTVTSAATCSDTDDVTITVTGEAVIPELPTVTIVQPADAAEFTQGDTDITFEGNAVDQFDVEVPPEDLEWTSDLDGVLGTGNVLDIAPATLAAGTHLITLTAVDAEGFEGTADITIVINQLPTVTIVRPDDAAEFAQDDTDITFEGNAVDQFDVEVPPEDLEWTSDLNGVLGTGNVLDIAPATLIPGTHTITLTGIDAGGLEGTADITIVISSALDVVSFDVNVLPYFTANCTACHNDALQQGDIRLDSYTEVSTGSNGNGPLIVAGDAADVTAILIPKLEAAHNDGPDDQAFVDDFLAQWIDDGANNN
jgi:PKD repeat protein